MSSLGSPGHGAGPPSSHHSGVPAATGGGGFFNGIRWIIVIPASIVMVILLVSRDHLALQSSILELNSGYGRAKVLRYAERQLRPPHGRPGHSPNELMPRNAVAADFVAVDGQSGDVLQITPIPTPSKIIYPTLKPGTRMWPPDDLNAEFKQDNSLPLIGIVTINAQAKLGGVGLHSKSEWMYPLAFHNKIEYAKKWGYDLIVEDNSIIDRTRDVAWSKIPVFRKWLPRYQWLMWMDMDAFFMRFDLDLEHLLDENVDFIVAKDWNGINLGVYFMRNSPYSYYVMEEMWNAPRSWWIPWEEQSALMHMMQPARWGRKAEVLLTHMMFPIQRTMNSYPDEFSYGNGNAKYQRGDFIAHFPNCKAFSSCRSTIERYANEALMIHNLPPVNPDPPWSYFPPER